MIMGKSPFMTHFEQMDTTPTLNSQVQELPKGTVSWSQVSNFFGRIRAIVNIGGLEDSVRTGVWLSVQEPQPSFIILPQLRQRISVLFKKDYVTLNT
jgi:hypothetical protein